MNLRSLSFSEDIAGSALIITLVLCALSFAFLRSEVRMTAEVVVVR